MAVDSGTLFSYCLIIIVIGGCCTLRSGDLISVIQNIRLSMDISAGYKMIKIYKFKKQAGFTLIELLVVISIIGLLSGMVLVNMGGALARARDARRKSDLDQIVKAAELYNFDHNSYGISNSGWQGNGSGWYNYEGGMYPRSIARALSEDGGNIPIVKDPSGNVACSPSDGNAYMYYICGDYGFFVYAKLEKPSAQDLATCNDSTCCTNLKANYGVNYAVGHL